MRKASIVHLWAGLLGMMGLAGPAVAQESAFRMASAQIVDREGNLNYVAPLQTLLRNKQRFDPDAYEQQLAVYYSFVGEFQPSPPPAAIPGAGPRFRLVEVSPVLTARAQASRVVLINEEHHQPAHRLYCGQLLRLLAPLGYRYFSLEALDPGDAAINERKFPLSSSGPYTREPQMANLIRAASRGGFRISSHEMTEAQEKEFNDWKKRSNYRDSLHAVHILALLQKDPNAKIVALVGYDHVLEREREGLKRLAGYLRELGKIDPVTIDQTEPYQPSMGAAPTKTMLLVSPDARPATTGEREGYVDFQVVHPPVSAVGNRPSWLATDPMVRAVTAAIPREYAGRSCLVQLYDQLEYQQYGEKAVPVDQYLTEVTQKEVRLFNHDPRRATIIKYKAAAFD